MEILFSLYSITLLVILNSRGINGVLDCHDHGEEWVDPDPLNRINCDLASKSVKREPRIPSQATEGGVTSEERAAIEGELKLCRQSLNVCSKQLLDLEYSSSSKPPPKQQSSEQQECMQSKVYMKRFINILLKVSKLNEDMPQNLDTHLYITVTPEQLKVLQQFSKGSNDVTLQKLDHVLSSVLMSSQSSIFLEEYIPWSVVADFVQSREMLMALVLGCLPMFLMWKVLNGHSLIRIMMMFLVSSFIISFSVTYCRMYKQAEIKQYAVIKKNPDIPVECRPPSELTWMETIGELFRTKFSSHPDACREYYEVVMLDPFLEVTPALVLSEMTASFFLHPSGMLGTAIANFSNGILGNLPFGINWLVLIGSFFLFVVIIFASCGGVIKLPFYMGGLELSGQRPQERITAGPQMRQAVEQMQHSSGPVPSDTTINSLMQTAASTDAGLVIMNVHGFQRLLSGGNTPVFHRDAIEEIQMPSPKKKDVCYTCEQHDQFESQGLAHIPGCAESRSGCCRAMGVETVAVRSKLELPLRKNCAEELQLKKTAASCESKDKHIQIERVEVNTEHTRGTKTKEGTDVLSSACQNMSTGDATASTEGSRKILVSNVEDEANKCRSGSIDCSDEETSFVKL